MCVQISDTFTVTEENIKQYAHLSGDDNSIHFEKSSVIGQDFQAPIAHGMLVMGLVTTVASRFTQKGMIITTYNMRFLKPIYPGETIEIIGEGKCEAEVVSLRIVGTKIRGEMELRWPK